MANLQLQEKHGMSGADCQSLTPSSVLEQSHGELISESSFSPHAHVQAEHCLPLSEDSVACLLTSLHHTEMSDISTALYQSEDLQQLSELSDVCEEMLNVDPDAACTLEEISAETRHLKPVNTSEIYSGQQEPSHQIHLMTCLSSKCPDIMSHHPPHRPVLTAPASNMTCDRHVHPPSSSYLICVPPIYQMNTNYSTSQQNISFRPLIHLLEPNRTYPVYQANPSHLFPPSHGGFPSHLPVLNPSRSYYPNPAVHRRTNAEHHSEAFTCAFSGSFPRDVHEDYRLWQRYCETAKAVYSSSLHVQALACFFVKVIGSLTVHLSHEAAVIMAIQEWGKKSPSEQEKYYMAAKMFMQLEEQERRSIREHVKGKDACRGCDMHFSTKHTSTDTRTPAHDLPEDSDVTAGHQVNTEEHCVQYLNEAFSWRHEVSSPRGDSAGHLIQHQDFNHQNEMSSVPLEHSNTHRSGEPSTRADSCVCERRTTRDLTQVKRKPETNKHPRNYKLLKGKGK